MSRAFLDALYKYLFRDHHRRPHAPESNVVVVGCVGGLIDLLDDRQLQEGRLLLSLFALAALGGGFLFPLAGNENGVYAVGEMVVHLTKKNEEGPTQGQRLGSFFFSWCLFGVAKKR